MINTNKLKGRMREMQITQADLATELNLKTCTVNQKINNVRLFNLTEAEIVCRMLQIDPSDFGAYFFT